MQRAKKKSISQDKLLQSFPNKQKGPCEGGFWPMWRGFLTHVEGVSDPCGGGFWPMWRWFLTHVEVVSDPCEGGFWPMWRGFLTHVKGVSDPCEGGFWPMWRGFLTHVKGVSDPCERVILRTIPLHYSNLSFPEFKWLTIDRYLLSVILNLQWQFEREGHKTIISSTYSISTENCFASVRVCYLAYNRDHVVLADKGMTSLSINDNGNVQSSSLSIK